MTKKASSLNFYMQKDLKRDSKSKLLQIFIRVHTFQLPRIKKNALSQNIQSRKLKYCSFSRKLNSTSLTKSQALQNISISQILRVLYLTQLHPKFSIPSMTKIWLGHSGTSSNQIIIHRPCKSQTNLYIQH